MLVSRVSCIFLVGGARKRGKNMSGHYGQLSAVGAAMYMWGSDKFRWSMWLLYTSRKYWFVYDSGNTGKCNIHHTFSSLPKQSPLSLLYQQTQYHDTPARWHLSVCAKRGHSISEDAFCHNSSAETSISYKPARHRAHQGCDPGKTTSFTFHAHDLSTLHTKLVIVPIHSQRILLACETNVMHN